jgi:3-isopropylmalate/(R)-2-methylmalate dehydratase large subunit
MWCATGKRNFSACYDQSSRAMGKTLLQKVWDLHTVRQLPTGQTQLFVGLHLVHEVTSPQAFDTLRAHGWPVKRLDRTFATVDHIVPTKDHKRPFLDVMAEDMISSLERNCRDFGVRLAGLDDERQGIVHVIGPELGLTQPGMTIACGDSHTSTHGAFGAVAFGIGTSQVRDVLASQCLAMDPLRVRRIRVTGALRPGVYAKDVILTIINRLGVRGGTGYGYEYAGDAIERMTMDERMTICNMSIEGGARVGYVNPDETTFKFLEGRPFAPSGEAFINARSWWRSIASDTDASYDDDVEVRAEELAPVVTWGVNPGQSIPVDGRVPSPEESGDDRDAVVEALSYMQLHAGQPIEGMRVDVAFVGSCTNSRLSDLREAARVVRGRHVAPHVRALIVPGSVGVRRAAEREGLDETFRAAGFEWREAGCSMCLGMNPDRLSGDQVCAASSNRNFKGRQGSPTGRTLLMSPAMVAAAAIAGEVTDVRKLVA